MVGTDNEDKTIAKSAALVIFVGAQLNITFHK